MRGGGDERLPVAGWVAGPAWPSGQPAPAVAAAPRPVAQASLAPIAEQPPSQPLPLVVARLPEAAPAAVPAPVVAAAAEPWVQRAPEAEAAAATEPGGAGAAAGGRSDRELDMLAHQLYDRLRSQLRHELLIDRERAGLITDLR
jgi:hypothetical protein